MSKQKLKVSVHNKKLLILSAIIAFAGVGAYVIGRSSAAVNNEQSYVMFHTANSVSINSQGITIVDIPQQYSPYYHAASSLSKAVELTTGSTLFFDPPGPSSPNLLKSCYVMKLSGQEAATVVIGSYGNRKQVQLTNGSNFKEYCVSASNDPGKTGVTVNVKHVSGGKVQVVHATQHLTPTSL